MLMRINTLGRKKILYIYLLLAGFGFVFNSFSQCPTVTNHNQSFCDVESPTVGNLVATANGNGVVWYDTATSTTPLSNAGGLISGDYYADDRLIRSTLGWQPTVSLHEGLRRTLTYYQEHLQHYL